MQAWVKAISSLPINVNIPKLRFAGSITSLPQREPFLLSTALKKAPTGVLNPEGKKGLNGEPATYEVLNPYSGEAQNHDWQDVQVKYFPAEFRLGESTDQNVDVGTSLGLEKLLYDATKEKNGALRTEGRRLGSLPYLKLTDEEATKIQTIGVEVENYIEENKVAFITGRKDFDKDWDSYVKGFDNVRPAYAA